MEGIRELWDNVEQPVLLEYPKESGRGKKYKKEAGKKEMAKSDENYKIYY